MVDVQKQTSLSPIAVGSALAGVCLGRLVVRNPQVVKRVLSQPVGTGCCDQSWAEMDFFQVSEKEYEYQ
jgi:hypothetical protein